MVKVKAFYARLIGWRNNGLPIYCFNNVQPSSVLLINNKYIHTNKHYVWMYIIINTVDQVSRLISNCSLILCTYIYKTKRRICTSYIPELHYSNLSNPHGVGVCVLKQFANYFVLHNTVSWSTEQDHRNVVKVFQRKWISLDYSLIWVSWLNRVAVNKRIRISVAQTWQNLSVKLVQQLADWSCDLLPSNKISQAYKMAESVRHSTMYFVEIPALNVLHDRSIEQSCVIPH